MREPRRSRHPSAAVPMHQHPNYELFEELGRGENTVVYRGYDLTLGREVAIKILEDQDRQDPRRRQRFLRQAQFLAQHDHDHVLRIHSVEPERGWIIMELMRGTLAQRVKQSRLEPDLVRSIVTQILAALDFLHQKQKIHGAVRPSNLLINDQGRVKLSDFEEVDAGAELRAPSGSKKYLAPELIRPDFGRCGAALDLYALGFTALELLAGPRFDTLFPGTGPDSIDADLAWLRWHSSEEEFPAIQSLIPGIPDDLRHGLERMLRKQVDERPPSAQAAQKALADQPLVLVEVDTASIEPTATAMGPTQVRELAPLPIGRNEKTAPSLSSPAATPARPGTFAKTKPARAGRSAPAFSRDWWNQQLGKPYVLYPLCVVLLGGALWLGWPRSAVKPVIPEPPAPEPVVETPPEVPPPLPPVEVVETLPRLPDTLEAKPGAPLDTKWGLPTRAMVRPLSPDTPLELILVPPGDYLFGVAPQDAYPWELSARTVRLDAPIYLGLNETTNHQYQLFASAVGESLAGTRWKATAARWAKEQNLSPENNELPVTNVTPGEAEAFCAWLGGRLPDEHEWESAIRGRDDGGYPYPWGKHEEPSATNCRLFRGERDKPSPALITSLPGSASATGFWNALGNAAEWCRGVDSSSGAPTANHVVRGCGFATAAGPHARVTWRDTQETGAAEDIGFRLAIPVALPK